jgi:hypothetical protein
MIYHNVSLVIAAMYTDGALFPSYRFPYTGVSTRQKHVSDHGVNILLSTHMNI